MSTGEKGMEWTITGYDLNLLNLFRLKKLSNIRLIITLYYLMMMMMMMMIMMMMMMMASYDDDATFVCPTSKIHVN